MPKQFVKIQNQRGLHARAASKFVKTAESFNCEAVVRCNDDEVCAQSIMGLLMLGAAIDCTIEIETTGKEAEDALVALLDLVNRKFDEE